MWGVGSEGLVGKGRGGGGREREDEQHTNAMQPTLAGVIQRLIEQLLPPELVTLSVARALRFQADGGNGRKQFIGQDWIWSALISCQSAF